MATKSWNPRQEGPGTTYRDTFSGPLTTNGDVTEAISIPGGADRSVQLIGAFDGDTIVIEGSNEATPTTYETLHDVNGNVMSFTASALRQIQELVTWLRARVSAGAGASTSVTVIFLHKGGR